MRVFTLQGTDIVEADTLPQALPATGFVWIACARREFEVQQAAVQLCLQNLCNTSLVELHIADLLNNQLPSHYDYTSQYDLLVFRRLSAGNAESDLAQPGVPLHASQHKGGPQVLKHIDTSPVGFAVFDRVLLTVHPNDCAVRDAYAGRLLSAAASDVRMQGARVPSSPADLMLRIVNLMVDGYLDLRREITRQLDHWQTELLNPKTRHMNWSLLLDTRLGLHQLDEICEDQRAAVQDWIDALETWPDASTPQGMREQDLLAVRSRDVLEHIERVVHHVRRMEQSAETAVQMHFSAQSNRTNDIMRTLTALTAIFLPLNLVTGIFGMNFEFLPIIHQRGGFWWAIAIMVTIAVSMGSIFWRKRYLARTRA
jgi:magnesium transporter